MDVNCLPKGRSGEDGGHTMSFYPFLSWSETTSMGSLWRWNKFWIRNWVVFLAKGSFWRDTKCAIMLNFRAGQANGEVQGDVGSRTAKNKQRLEDAHQGLAEGLVLTTEGGVVDVASGHPPP